MMSQKTHSTSADDGTGAKMFIMQFPAGWLQEKRSTVVTADVSTWGTAYLAERCHGVYDSINHLTQLNENEKY